MPRGVPGTPGPAFLLCPRTPPPPAQAGGIYSIRAWSWLRLGTSWSHNLCSSPGSRPPVSSPPRQSFGGSQPLEERDFQAGLRFSIKSGPEKGSDGEGWLLD